MNPQVGSSNLPGRAFTHYRILEKIGTGGIIYGRRGIEMKAEDIVEDLYVCSTHSYLLVITLEGKVIGIPTTQVRSSGRATQGVRIINLDDKDRVCSIAKVRES